MKDKKDIEQLAREYAISRGANRDKYAFRTITNRDLYDHTTECFEAGYELAQQSQSAYIQQALIAYQKLLLKSQLNNDFDVLAAYDKVLEQLNVSDGWVEITSANELIKENALGYIVIDTSNFIQFTNLRHLENRLLEGHPFTHYQPIVKPNPPQLK